MTEAADWARVKALFQQALDQPLAEREHYVLRESGQDEALRDEVQSMLAAHAAQATVLQGEARDLLDGLAADHALPSSIGPFRPTALIGRGGMGVVYRAERDVDGGVQIVALKLIAAGFTEPALIRRFERERSILARLQHPNIAHFIDGGMSADGSPWLAMQYIDGEDLLRWCDARRLTLRERVTLFLQVIDAAGFAHRNLVVHRDIKPSNILVDTTGQVRLLDFGIAKLLDEVADQGVTGTAAAPMTPEYAAPEQILGEGVSTATDVHALGVVLFELLCGRLPYVIGNGRHAAAVICEQEPQRLRQALSRRSDESSRRRAEPVDIARQRSVSTQELRRTLDRDLEQIVATAIARAPKERYGSAEAFAEDLRAWLDDRPLRSRPADWRERARKFVRRHRVGVAVSAALIAVAAAGIVATSWQAEQATMQALRADAARRVLSELFQAADPQAMDGRALTARELVDQGAARLRNDRSIDTDLRASLLTDLGNVYHSLGELKQARSLFDEIRTMTDLGTGTRQQALMAHARVLLTDSDYAAAEHIADALDAMQRSLPATDVARIETTILRAEIDLQQRRAGQVISTLERLLDDWPAGSDQAQLRADVLCLLAEAQADEQHYDLALPLLRRALIDYQATHASATTLNSTRHEIARSLGAMNQFDEALPAFQAVLAEHTRILGADHPLSLSTKGEIADLLKRMHRFEEASALFKDVIDSKRRTLGANHDDLAVALFNYGSLLYVRDEFASALPYFEEAAKIWAANFGDDGDRTLTARDAMASVRAEIGDTSRATSEMAMIVALRETQGKNIGLVGTLNSYGIVLDRADRLAESCAQFRRSIDISATLFPDQPEQARWTRALLGRCLRRSGSFTDAASELRWARDSFLAQPIEPGPRVALIDMELARTLRAAGGESNEITSLYEEALRLRRSKLNPEHPKIAETERELAAFGRGESLPEGL
ncbi:MAG: serine/threonine protein kinase [Xanthomonadales bacterium]|nr:serine/threonine protein kinase [Xanthomonadales bacterium]MBP6077961.1 serine/threonine protein kinase [Xanthomonadales bacterium]MBP7623060.1 serine/threonine protein kinase [Xanthomonadales bacterium]